MKTGLSRLLTTTALGAPLALGVFAADAASDIGKVAAVNPSMDGTPPDAGARTLSLGSGVLQNERIETSEDGSGQLLFLDQTSLSIAPRSDIVLDKYVYDADQQTGEVAVTLTKGVLRMIGGRITKRRDGIVRTPTATIGVRGGLALVIVEPSGQTRVCHVAGEYTKVDSSSGGQVVLSRPNACAVVAGGAQPIFEGLIEAEELADIYREIEGKGNGGRTVASDSIDTAGISGVNSSQKRGPHDTPVSTSGHSFVPDEGSRDEDEARQDQDVRVVVVEVPTEQVAAPVAPPVEIPIETPLPVSGPFITGLAGGAVTNVAGDGATGTTFVQVLQGSLIGQSADGGELRVPVPETDGVNDAVFDTTNIIDRFIPNNSEFTATTLAPSSGLFEFFLGDEEFDEDTGDLIGGSFSSELGDIVGVGFTDQAEQFTYVEFSDDERFSQSTGFAVFGNPTFGQSQFAEGDATLRALTGSEAGGPQFVATINPALLSDTLINGIPNTVEAFKVQPNQFLHGVRGDAPRRGQTPFFMIGNQGFAKFDRADTIIETGDSDIDGKDLVGGGKWLNGALHIGESGGRGPQFSNFMVFADDIKTFEGSGPIVSGTAFTSDFDERLEPETRDSELFISVGGINVGSLEDDQGNTVFGETNRYTVLSNLHRAGLDSESSAPPALRNDAGGSLELIQISGDTSVNGTTNRFFENPEDAGDFNALLARDASLDEVIANPLPLAGARVESFYDTPSERQVDVLDRGFAAGMAVCEGGLCGDVERFSSSNTGLSDGVEDFSGSYVVRSGQFDEFSLTFGGHTLVNASGTDPEAINFDTSNEVLAVFNVSSSGVGALDGANVEGNFARFQYQGGGTTSAYIDDNRFAALGQGNVSITTEGASVASAPASFAIASSGLLGTSDLVFPTETELAPTSVRWGYWSSAIESPIEGSTDARTDLVHLGNWVAGVGFNFQTDDIPSAGVASFDGLAIGTMTNLVSFDRRIVGGNFNMTYSFASQTGNFNLNIPDASLDENIAISGFSDVFDGRNVNAVTNTITDVSGAFFANPSAAGVEDASRIDGIAAVGGTFESVNLNQSTHTTGVFAGDRATFTPPASAITIGPDSISTTPGSSVTVTTPGSVPSAPVTAGSS